MGYQYSELDYKNEKWFVKDIEARSLVQMKLSKGTLRGLHPCSMQMQYPISAIAGKNGSGKSTLLAIACCAYHNRERGYMPTERNKSYYTFSDFFIQTTDEVKVEGLEIRYQILGKWKVIGEGLAWQKRVKNRGGKWNQYDKRMNRNVVFLGIQRIVPPGERKTERTYSGKFKSAKLNEETKQRILAIAGTILGKQYTSLDLRTVGARKLFVVDRNAKHYSGFNMGAGENAVFTLLIELFSAGRNTLLVIDEIELGLHEEAQRRLIQELKKLCLEMHIQIICSTHSAMILDELPPVGRFYVESFDAKTEIMQGISSEYAMGKLTGGKKKELVVFTEDEVGKAVVSSSLPQSLRERIEVIPIGSDQAVLRQLSARYREKSNYCIAFLDGDKRKERQQQKKQVIKYLEGRTSPGFEEWIENRLCYLPGAVWPEKFIVSQAKEKALRKLAKTWRLDEEELLDFLICAENAGKHNEFYMLAEKLSQDISAVRAMLISALADSGENLLMGIECDIEKILSSLAEV